MAKASSRKGTRVSLDLIDEPVGRIRLDISDDGIQELADSIRTIGQLQPILLRPVGDRFEIVFGHRRFLACRSLGKKKIDAGWMDLDDVQVALMRATENVGREDISLIEEAAVYLDLMETHKLTVDEISRRMGKSVGIVKRRMDLLKMPPCLQKAIHSKQINYSVGEELWSLGELGKIEYYLGFAIDHGATKSVVRMWVQDEKKKARLKDGAGAGGDSLENPMQARPVYVACDVCGGAMEVGTETVIRTCEVCTKAIKQAVEVEV